MSVEQSVEWLAGETETQKETCPRASLCTTSTTGPEMGRRGGDPVTNRLSYGTFNLAGFKDIWSWSWSSSCDRQSVHQFVLVSGSPLGPMTRFYFFFRLTIIVRSRTQTMEFFLTITFLFFLGRPLWRKDGSVTYSAIADWSGHWRPITTIYRLIWDCVPFLSHLTIGRDYGGSILTRLHTGLRTFVCTDSVICPLTFTAQIADFVADILSEEQFKTRKVL
jgi:hypothetical protein